MSRKNRKGYYIEGQFIAMGSAADRQRQIESGEDDAPSRTELKMASAQLQELGEGLLMLRGDLFTGLALPEKLREAILEARRLRSPEALRRQKQFIGKLMHQLDEAGVQAVASALQAQHSLAMRATERLHQAETWRDALLASDERLAEWIQAFPATDTQQLRALIRQARKDVQKSRPGEPARQGRAYREIFRLLRTQLDSGAAPRN